MKTRTLALGSSLLLALFGCGPDLELANPTVRLALDPFGANALLELFVLDGGTASCAALLGGSLSPEDEGVTQHASAARPAQRLNNGGTLRFDLEELPAERELTFYARAREAGALLAHDCADGVVIPADGHVNLELEVREAQSP